MLNKKPIKRRFWFFLIVFDNGVLSRLRVLVILRSPPSFLSSKVSSVTLSWIIQAKTPIIFIMLINLIPSLSNSSDRIAKEQFYHSLHAIKM